MDDQIENKIGVIADSYMAMTAEQEKEFWRAFYRLFAGGVDQRDGFAE